MSTMGGTIIKLSDAIVMQGGKHTTANERRDFINWLFDHVSEINCKSKSSLTSNAIDKYFKDFNIKMNRDWVYSMIRFGIVRENDKISFETEQKYTFDEYCEHPSLIRK